MKTLVVDSKHELSIREVPMPAYKECQALVKIQSCGVCNGTDMKLIHGNFKNFDTYPATLGHEGVGKVVETGAKVKNLKVGDLVLLPFVEGKLGDIYSGWGAYSEYAVVGDADAYVANGMGPGTPEFSEGYFAQTVIKPEDGVDAVEASMVVTFREVLSAIRRFQFKPNESVFIIGAGPVGLCFIKFCKLLGLKTVISSDIDEEKVAFANKFFGYAKVRFDVFFGKNRHTARDCAEQRGFNFDFFAFHCFGRHHATVHAKPPFGFQRVNIFLNY